MTTKKLIKRIVNAKRDDLAKYADQFHYGHSEIILRALGFPKQSYIKGILQHGVLYPDISKKYYDSSLTYASIFRKAPYFAWNTKTADLWNSLGGESFVIGSPWAHLCKSDRKEIFSSGLIEESKLAPVLYFPHHSYFGWLSHRDFNFRKTPFFKDVPSEDITICLYWSDFLDPKTRKFYEEISPNVVCAGYRGASAGEIAWDNLGGRASFLHNIFQLIRNCEIAIFDEIETPFWYANSLEKATLVTKEESIYEVLDATGTKVVRYSNRDIAANFGILDFQPNEVLNQDHGLVNLSREILGFDYTQSAVSLLREFIAQDKRIIV